MEHQKILSQSMVPPKEKNGRMERRGNANSLKVQTSGLTKGLNDPRLHRDICHLFCRYIKKDAFFDVAANVPILARAGAVSALRVRWIVRRNGRVRASLCARAVTPASPWRRPRPPRGSRGCREHRSSFHQLGVPHY